MDTCVTDITGKKAKAIDVFSIAIKYFKDHMLKTLERHGLGIGKDDIHWVLTVPAICNDPAKQFMRKAAEKVRIRQK